MNETYNFLIHKHETPHPHYDFYLQIGEELKSWIIPNGIPDNSKGKKVAVENDVLNESIEIIATQEVFEDSYGAGKTKLWDKGTYSLETNKKIKIIIEAQGNKLNGKYLLHVPNWGRWTKKRLWTLEKIG